MGLYERWRQGLEKFKLILNDHFQTHVHNQTWSGEALMVHSRRSRTLEDVTGANCSPGGNPCLHWKSDNILYFVSACFWVKPSFGWSFAFEQKFWVEQNQAKQLAAFSPRLACLLEVAGKSCKEGTKPSGPRAFHNWGLPTHQPYIQFGFGFIIIFD